MFNFVILYYILLFINYPSFQQNFDSPIRNQIEFHIPLEDEEVPAVAQPEAKPAQDTAVHHHHHHVTRHFRVPEKKAPPPVAKKPVRFRSKTTTTEHKMRSRSPPPSFKKVFELN